MRSEEETAILLKYRFQHGMMHVRKERMNRYGRTMEELIKACAEESGLTYEQVKVSINLCIY